MDIPYEVVSVLPINDHETEVVVETQLPVVVNGYGGGRVTFVAKNATLQADIEKKIAWKFTEQTTMPDGGRIAIGTLRGNLTKIQVILDRVDEQKAVEKRKEAESAAIAALSGSQKG